MAKKGAKKAAAPVVEAAAAPVVEAPAAPGFIYNNLLNF